MLRKKCQTGLILTVIAPCLSACGDGEGSASRHLLPGAIEAPSLTAEAQRVRDMQKVQFEYYNPNTKKTESFSAGTGELTEFYVEALCAPGDGTSTYTGESNCAKAVLAKRLQLCVAEFLLKASQTRAQPTRLTAQYHADKLESRYVDVLPQSHAANVDMLRRALDYALLAMNQDVGYSPFNPGPENLQIPAVTTACIGSTPEDGSNPTGDGLYQANPFATRTGEAKLADMTQATIFRAYDVGREAVKLGVENILAVSDAERSSAVSAVTTSRRAWMERELSRLAAAQWLVGGANPDGYILHPELTEPAVFPSGFCPGKPLSAQAQRALELLRAAAPPPRWILDPSGSVPMSTLLHGPVPDTTTTGGSVGARLADALNDGALYGISDLPKYFGLEVADFEDARQYLHGEIQAFGRDLDDHLALEPGKSYYAYTAVRVPAQDPPDAFYVALVVGQGDDGAWSQGSRNPTKMSLGTFREFARLTATRFLQNPTSVGVNLAQSDIFKQAGANLEQRVISDVTGRISIHTVPQSSTSAQIEVKYAKYVAPTDTYTYPQYRILNGDRAVKCALDGTIEGRQCTDYDISSGTVASLTEYTPVPGPNPEICVNAVNCYSAVINGPTGASLLAEKARLYVMDATGAGCTACGPGNYKLVGAMELRGPAGSYTEIPANSVDYNEAARIMRPRKEWCNQPRHSCADSSFDDRLPLEDELSGDGDGVESSWKHYLALAKQAAEESDALGEAFVDAALKVDENQYSESIRQEQQRQSLNGALEKIQDTCGTAVDAQKLLNLLVGTPESSCNSTQDCKGSAQTCVSGTCKTGLRKCSETEPCPSTSQCVSGSCTPDLNKLVQEAGDNADPDLKRIADCMQSAVYDFVAIGDARLCVTKSGNSKSYCEGATPENPCPRPTSTDESGNPSCGYDQMVDYDDDPQNPSRTDVLALFQASPPRGNPAEVCDAIAYLRDNVPTDLQGASTRSENFSKVTSSRVFLPEFVVDVASRLGFEARLGSYAAVTLSGTPMYYTGSTKKGPHIGVWPCAPQNKNGVVSPPDPNRSLKSQLVDCESNVNDRGIMNDRLMRAVMLARFVGHSPYGKGLYLPGQAYDITPTPSAGTSTTIQDQGSVSQVDMKIKANSPSDDIPVRVYNTTDQPTASSTAYTTVWYKEIKSLQILDSTYAKPRYFAIADFTGDVTGGYYIALAWNDTNMISSDLWGMLGGVGKTSIEAMKAQANYDAWLPVMPETVANMTTQWQAWFKDTNSRTERLVDRTHGAPFYRMSFPLVTVEQWFDGLSTQILAPHSNSPAFDYFYDTLSAVSRGSAPRELPGFISQPVDPEEKAWPAYDPVEFKSNNMLDALELICLASAVDAGGVQPDMNNPPTVTSPAELPYVKAYLDESARRIEDWASRFVIPNFPKAAADFVRAKSKSGVVPALGGTYATAMTNLRASLVEFAQVAPLMAYELRQLSAAIDQARISLSETDLKKELNQLNFESTMASNAAACAGSVAALDAKLSFGASAAVTCANAIAQSLIAAKQLQVGDKISDLNQAMTMSSFQEQLNTHAQALQSYAARISKSMEELDGSIAELERQRLSAQRALNEAIQIAGFTPTNAANISSALVSQKVTTEERYKRAFKNAQRMADLAKRSIEQRLGILLADMPDDLPLVDAPQSWEGTVCDRSGIDWYKVRTANAHVPENYADAFIGEYVDKLERVVESYRLAHNFHEGSDTAVISLRDDVLNVRAPCTVQTRNLLEHSAELNALADADGRHGWAVTGCIARTDPNTGKTLNPQNCISVVPFEDFPQEPLWGSGSSLLKAQPGLFPAFYLYGGKASRTECAANECDYQPESALTQKISLSAGTYRLSYFTSSCQFSSCNMQYTPESVLSTVSVSNQSQALEWYSDGEYGFHLGDQDHWWRRLHAIIRLPSAGEVSIQFRPAYQSVIGNMGQFAAPMLEALESTGGVADSDLKPDIFIPTTGGTSLNLKSCEDTDGIGFRANGWRRGEMPLCPDGFNGQCDKSKAQVYGFSEIPFSINQRDIESGRILKKAGFAVGNFNYRIESLALNFVGTGIRNCSQSDSPSTCNSGGYVPYTLDHIGPYFVRNHMGGNFEAKLFTGHIQTARGLATERYITNPISSADQQLLGDYFRDELQGRPLDGNFVIRLWDSPDVNFWAIKDVQVVLKYRYWTRFD